MSAKSRARVVATLYDAALEPSTWPQALKALANEIGASGASYMFFDKHAHIADVALVGPTEGKRDEYVKHYYAIDPFYPVVNDGSRRGLVQLSRSVSASVLRNNGWYNDFLLRAGVDDILAHGVLRDETSAVSVGVHLDGSQSALQARAALKRLMVPWAKAARLHAELYRAGWRSSVAFQALNQLSAGIIITDTEGRVIEITRTAERIIARNHGLAIRNGRIRAARAFETTTITKLIAAAGSGLESGRVTIRGTAGHRYVLTVAPLRSIVTGQEQPLVMILIVDPREQTPSEEDLTSMYHLSPAEARLAVALVKGQTLQAVATATRVKITTVRTQLSQVLHKVGVERQSDLVRLLTTVQIVRGG
jgi:DNA-binding CsgD family transcriptional regulator